MLPFKVPFQPITSGFKIKHGDQLIFLGSCFSDEMSLKAQFYGFERLSNPFGTIFHPDVIARNIKDALNFKDISNRIYQREDLFFSWDASGTIFGYSEDSLKEKLRAIQIELVEKLKFSKVLFITFGTAWGYSLIENDLTVANCHKLKQSSFQKKLADIDLLEKEWSLIIDLVLKLNPELKIVFTVSPVRHIKDGLIENNQSKAILVELVRRLNILETVSYFPSYEIINDELRDYRFFKKDGVHPNEDAIDYVWSKFELMYMTSETITLNNSVQRLRLSEGHKSLYEKSDEYLKFVEKHQKDKKLFLEQYSCIKW